MTHAAARFAMALLLGTAAFGTATAHVPYMEKQDFSPDQPFRVKNIPQSKAMYAFLEASTDVDHYVMTVDEPTRIYMHTNIPFCPEYRDFSVTYALLGPGLPAPTDALPVPLPEGYGAIIVRDEMIGAPDRPVMFERFSARTYWEGPEYSINVDRPGEYRMIVWQESGAPGDYVAVIGRQEQFGPKDIWLAMTNTPTIRRGDELHVACEL